MMDYPLCLQNILYRARNIFPKKEIVSRDFSGTFRYNYGEMARRVGRLANVLKALDIGPGERVGSLAWNNHRHLELYFAAPCYGAVLNTLNLRLSPEHLIHCINFAENKVIFVEEDLVPMLESICDRLPTVRAYVVMTDKPLGDTGLTPAYSYEELLAGQPDEYDFSYPDEWSPAIMAYTTATTGLPKGVVYSHRGLYLLSLTNTSGEWGIFERDVDLPIVPMFHVNAWCRPYSDAMAGTKLVLAGSRPRPEDYCRLFHEERVTMSAGVPTVWMGILQHLLDNPGRYDLSCVKYFVSGGAPLSVRLAEAFDTQLGITLVQGYGQTETTPTTLYSVPKSYLADLPAPQKYLLQTKSGFLFPGLEMRVINEQGEEVRHDGKEMGELQLKGPWVLREYYRDEKATEAAFSDGWFRTGDIVTVDEEAYVQVMDRTKDLIKSGGEWISSVDMENTLMGHPSVAEAAVIGVPHEKWQERPLACVVLRSGTEGRVSKDELRDFLSGKLAKWWLPDDFVFLDEIPKTSVGKFSKRVLRDLYREGKLAPGEE